LDAREENESHVEATATATDEKGKLTDLKEVKESLKDKTKDKENLRIDTAAITPPPSELPRRRPGPLNLSTSKNDISPSLPSALATARVIDDLGRVPYPEGVKSPKVELNINARDGKFRYINILCYIMKRR
jgi:translation initiation factor 4G